WAALGNGLYVFAGGGAGVPREWAELLGTVWPCRGGHYHYGFEERDERSAWDWFLSVSDECAGRDESSLDCHQLHRWGDWEWGREASRFAAAVWRQCRRCDDSRSEEHTSELQSPCNLVCR